MWPRDDEPSSASGDWTVRLYSDFRTPATVTVTLQVIAASMGKPYIARIIGRDPTYAWKRVWMKPKWEFPSRNANRASIVRLVLPVTDIGTLPAALEIRWGPATGNAYVDKTGASGRHCAYRGFFILSLDGLKQVQEQHVALLIDDAIVAPGPPRRPPGTRPTIDFDEEV